MNSLTLTCFKEKNTVCPMLHFAIFIFIFSNLNGAYADASADVLTLTLEKAINIALSSSRRMGNALDMVRKSEVNLELAESEFNWTFIPKADTGFVGGGKAGEGFTIGGGLDVSKKFECGTKFSIYPTLMKAAGSWQANFRTSVSQPLLRGFGREYTLASVFAANYANRTAIRAYYQAEVRLILQTILNMYEIVKQEMLYKLEKDAITRVKKFCTATKMKEKIGLCDALDVYRAENELKLAEESVAGALERLQDAMDTLRDTLALPLDQEIQIDLPIVYKKIELALDEGVAIALEKRIENDQALDALHESRRLRRGAKNNLLPEINLVVDYTTFLRDEVFTSLWSNRKHDSKWGIGFTTSNDFSNTKESAAYEQSRLAVFDAERNIEQVKDTIILDVKRTLRALKRAEDRIISQEEQITNAEKGFHLARVKFEHAMNNNFDMITAEKTLRQAETGYINAIVDHKMSEFKLIASLGALADKPNMCQ